MKERKLEIELVMDNAAFGDDGERCEGAEVARILRGYADAVENDSQLSAVILRDVNGNMVGRAIPKN